MLKQATIRSILMALLILSILTSPLESIFLPTAQAGSSEPDVGLVAWADVGSNIDLTKAGQLFSTIYSQNANEIVGTYKVYLDNYNTEDVNLYISSNGVIAAYYGGNDPASKTILWNSDKIFFSKLAVVIGVGQSLGYTIDPKNVKYYDYRYPDANRIMITTQSLGESYVGNYDYGSFLFNIPNQATVYEMSYSIYLNDLYSATPATTIAIDGSIIGGGGNGVVYNSYSSYIPTDVEHIFGVMSNAGAQSAVAVVIIYKDDNDDSKNSNTISIKNADYTYDDVMIEPLLSKTVSTPTIPNKPVYTYAPVPTPVVTMPIDMPTVQPTERIPDQTVAVPTSTPVAPRKPPKASVDLHGERTNIELGQQALLKGSIVSFNTNRDKMHAQVIIIPPSGVSVVSADFVKSPAGQYTSDFDLDPGKGKDIEVTIVPNEAGEFKVISKVTYYFGENKDDNGYEETKLDIKAGQKGQNSGVGTGGQETPSQDNVPKSQPGFDVTFAIGVFMISFLYLRKK